MRGSRLLALALLLLGLRAEAAVARSTLQICTDEPEAASILRRLDGWMSTARIVPRTMADCGKGEGYVGRFEIVGTTTAFVLQNPGGGLLRQRLPWLEPSPTPLAEIDRLQRLTQFSLVLESLLAEDRLGLAAPPPAEKPPPPAPPPTRPPAPKTSPPRVARADPPRALEEEKTPEEEEEVPDEGADEASPRAEEVVVEGPYLDLRPDEEPDEEEDLPPPPRQPGIDELFPVLQSTWVWEAEVFGALRLRTPDFFGPEAGLGLGYGPLALRLGFQIPTRWDLEGRPLGVSSLWAGLGLRHLSRIEATEIGLSLGLTAEWLRIERLDLPWAEAHTYADAGLSLGAELRFRLLGGTMGAGAEVGGMPTARTIRLPEGGQAVLGGVWGRIAIRWGI